MVSSGLQSPSSNSSESENGGMKNCAPIASSVSTTTTDNKNNTTPPPQLWKIETLPGKGKALIATTLIKPGTLILSEPPIITTDVITSSSTIETDLARALRLLPKKSQRAFLSLHNNYPGQPQPLQNIIRSNGYPLGPSSDVGGVFEHISRINHSCLPNAVHAWNVARGEETVYCVREIQPGVEITLSYHSGGPSSTRQTLLAENFGFTCKCELCALPAKELRASDARLIRAQNLDATIGDAASVRNSPGKVLRNCKSLKEILEVEGVRDDRLSRLWFDCFQVCNFHSDEARASVFLKRYCDAKRISAGEDGSDVLEMEVFVGAPRKHESFGVGEGWRSGVGDVPVGLGEAEFERWLWREG